MEWLQGFPIPQILEERVMGNCCHHKGCALDALRERQGNTLRIVWRVIILLIRY